MSAIGKRLGAAWRPVVVLALALGLAIPGWSAAATSAQGTLPELAAAAPESTVLFHQIDLDFEGAQWQQTEELLARVGVPDALDLWREEMLQESAKSGEFTEADLDALLGGEMAIIVTSDAFDHFVAMHMKKMMGHDEADEAGAPPEASADDGAFGLAAVLVPGDPDAAWEYAQRQVSALAEQENAQVEQSEYGDAEMIAVELARQTGESDEMAEDPFEEMFGRHGHRGFVAARDGDLIIAAPTQADVTGIVDVINGDSPSLADSAVAQEVVSHLAADALSMTYLDGQAIVESLGPDLIESIESLVPNVPREAWGGAVGLAISASEPGFRLDSFARYPEGADLDALQVANDPEVVASAERAPEGTFIFEAGIVPPNAFAGLPFSFAQAVNSATGESQFGDDQEMMTLPSPEQIEAEIARATETLGFNPATDLFSLLGTEFIAFASFPSISMEGFGMDGVAAINTTDPAAMAETARKIAAWIERAAPEANISLRPEGEDTLFVLSDPETEGAPSIEFGVVGDQAIVALGSGLDDLLNGPSGSLADDDQYQTVMSELPADFYQVVYVDIGQAIAPIMMFTGEFSSAQITDADLACTEFVDQSLAQAAYDADPIARSDLDLDFDGEACEDAFSTTGSTPAAAQGSLENIRALAMVGFQQDDGAGSSTILYIVEPGS